MSALHALLIGINDYFPRRLPDGRDYPSLRGAARDVERMKDFLCAEAGLEPARTQKLLSRADEDDQPSEPPDRRPTYANIVAAFKRLSTEAAPGDRVYVHYSGHGARVPTEYPGITANGQDEALVPCDIGEPGSRYLRDLELAFLLRLLVEKGLHVTAVLDCCHSGGMVRGRRRVPAEAVPRRVLGVRLPSVPSAVAERDLLLGVWRQLRGEARRLRGLSLLSRLPVVRYVLFAACRPEELAYEYPFVNGEPQGALTYCLLDILKQSGLGLSCGEIRTRLVASVYGQIVDQTPMLVGDELRPFLGEGPARQPHRYPLETPMVLRLDEDGRVLISAGQSLLAKVGGRVIMKDTSGREETLVIREVGATESWAEGDGKARLEKLLPGKSVEILPQLAIRLIPPQLETQAAEQTLARLREALRKYPGDLVEIEDETEAPDLCVAVDPSGACEIRDPAGVPLPYVALFKAATFWEVQEILRRLDHLARFRKIRMVENPQPPSWLRIGLELCGDDPSGAPVPFPPGGLDLSCGKTAILRIVNRSSLRLDISVMDLAPDYSVRQLLPPRQSFSILPLGENEGEKVRVRAWLPPGHNEGVDILKVFATRGAAAFRCMELPALGQPLKRVSPRRGGLSVSALPELEWITTQVEIRVRR